MLGPLADSPQSMPTLGVANVTTDNVTVALCSTLRCDPGFKTRDNWLPCAGSPCVSSDQVTCCEEDLCTPVANWTSYGIDVAADALSSTVSGLESIDG